MVVAARGPRSGQSRPWLNKAAQSLDLQHVTGLVHGAQRDHCVPTYLQALVTSGVGLGLPAA